MNDQLVEINGVSLLGLDNARAIQVLREAMMKDGRIHGFIGITVLRPLASRTAAQTSAGRDRELRVSQADTDDGGRVHALARSLDRSTNVGPSSGNVCRGTDFLSVSLPTAVTQVWAVFASFTSC